MCDRLVGIDTCKKCPHLYKYRGDIPDVSYECVYKSMAIHSEYRMVGKTIAVFKPQDDIVVEIPKWCPLPIQRRSPWEFVKSIFG